MSESSVAQSQVTTSPNIHMDRQTRQVWRNDKIVNPKLAPAEFAILEFLLNHTSEESSAADIYVGSGLSRISGRLEEARIASTIKAQISYIRQKLGAPNIIQGIDGSKYRLSVNGSEVPLRVYVRNGRTYTRWKCFEAKL